MDWLLSTKPQPTVYIWLPRVEPFRVGHGSLKLSNGTYISWWPDGKKPFAILAHVTYINGSWPLVRTVDEQHVKGSKTPTLLEDIKAEGALPDLVMTIPESIVLDEEKMEEWWLWCKSSRRWSIIENCCWAVRNALLEGGIDRNIILGDEPCCVQYPEELYKWSKEIPDVDINYGTHLCLRFLGAKMLSEEEMPSLQRNEYMEILLTSTEYPREEREYLIYMFPKMLSSLQDIMAKIRLCVKIKRSLLGRIDFQKMAFTIDLSLRFCVALGLWKLTQCVSWKKDLWIVVNNTRYTF